MPTKNVNEAFMLEKINEYVAQVNPDDRNWFGTLENLESFIFQNIEEDERDIQIKINFFEKSIEDMKKKLSSSLSKFQEIHMEMRMAQCFEKFGAWDKALSAYQKILILCRADVFALLKSEAIRYMGHIYLMRNQWEKAFDSYQISWKLCQAKGDQEGEAYAYSSIGIVNFEQGKYSLASKYWEKGLELAERLNETKLIAQINNNLGAMTSILGNWGKALTYYEKSASLFERSGEYRGLAETYHNMAMTYADAERWSASSRYYEKSCEIAKEIGDVRLQAMVKLNRVELYISIGDYCVGLALCNQALLTFQQLNDHLGEAETYKFLGILYAKKGEWYSAGTYFNDSIYLAKKHNSPLLQGEAHFENGKMQKQNGNTGEANKHFKVALTLFERLQAKKDIEKVKRELTSIEP